MPVVIKKSQGRLEFVASEGKTITTTIKYYQVRQLHIETTYKRGTVAGSSLTSSPSPKQEAAAAEEREKTAATAAPVFKQRESTCIETEQEAEFT